MAERIGNEEHEHLDVEDSTSDSQSVIDGPVSEKPHGLYVDGTIPLKEEDNEFILLKHRFYTSIGSLAQYCTIVAGYKNAHSTPTGRARLEAFRLFLKAMMEKRNGNPNVRTGWYGSSNGELQRIMNDGFGACRIQADGGLCGFGLYLYPESSAIDSVLSSAVDGAGLRHVVFCRVILGNAEEVLPGSTRSFPSSENFDSGVDNLRSPKKYIVWYPHANTHILPMCILSVKLDFRSRGPQREAVGRPSSPWIPFSRLISVLSESLPLTTMCLVRRYHTDFMERKITKQQLIRHLRELSGDKLLISAIKTFRDKRRAVATVSSRKCSGSK